MARREEQTVSIKRARRLVSDHHLVCHGHDDDDHDRDVDDDDEEEEDDVPLDIFVIPSSDAIQTKGFVHIVLHISKAERYKTKSYNFQIVIFDRKTWNVDEVQEQELRQDGSGSVT